MSYQMHPTQFWEPCAFIYDGTMGAEFFFNWIDEIENTLCIMISMVMIL